MPSIWDQPKEGSDFMSNFAIMIPQGPFVPHKPKPIQKWKKVVCFLIGHRWGRAGISYMGPAFPMQCKRCKITKWFDKPTFRMRFTKWADRSLDKTWTPLCKIGLHRWKSHYGFSSFSYGGDGPHKTIKQHIFKCSCCKETKTVNVK